MKNSPTDHPRFTCRVVRGCLSVLGDTTSGEPRGPGASHVAACADCRQFFGACVELAVALKRDAACEWRDAPAGLEQNILRAVNRAAREAAPAPRNSRGAWLSFAAVAACAVAVAVVFQFRTPVGSTASPMGAGVAVSPVDPATLAAAQQLIASVPSDLFASMQPRAEALLKQEPLQKEVEAVKSDARTAVRFLARNFLPASAEASFGGE